MRKSENVLEFMNVVKDILEDTEEELLLHRCQQMKSIIDNLVEQERKFAKAGIR